MRAMVDRLSPFFFVPTTLNAELAELAELAESAETIRHATKTRKHETIGVVRMIVICRGVRLQLPWQESRSRLIVTMQELRSANVRSTDSGQIR